MPRNPVDSIILLEPLEAARRVVRMARQGQLLQLDDDSVGDLVRELLVDGVPEWLKESAGHVYLAANASWPGVFKMGFTRRGILQRMKGLYTEGLLTPWLAQAEWRVHDAQGVETRVFQVCRQYRVRGEMFHAPYEVLHAAMAKCIEQDLADLNGLLAPVLGQRLQDLMAGVPACAVSS